MTLHFRLLALVCCVLSLPALADGPDEAKGLWMTPEGDAVIQFAPCAEPAGALCGIIVWDKDAGTAADTCGVRIAQLARYEKDAWRDGWVYDPRDDRKYKGAVRARGSELRIRAFVGVEVLGQTEQLKRVDRLPDAPQCKR
ncbi:DUF2147 domain-containing protein [Hydrogenophaga flava]|uniref:DUF2147 domain-containing protein n=1 Tax=Hydrogenophaga flava TaxID=65657 RepID=UPI000825AD7C|nr:DUF2147 domain-containing protein [Hydrogenophaga flava]